MNKVEVLQNHIRTLPVWRQLDKEIVETLVMLWAHGFETMHSCAGHEDKVRKRFHRHFFPYINLRPGVVRVSANGAVTLEEVGDIPGHYSRLNSLISDFNFTVHAYEPKGYDPEMDLIEGTIYGQNTDVDKKWPPGFYTLCNKAVRSTGILPQEMLTLEFRLAFLKRTQDEMRLFTSFLASRL